jgi:hypothetical protein
MLLLPGQIGKAWQPSKSSALSEGDRCTEKYFHLVLKGLNSIYPFPVVFQKEVNLQCLKPFQQWNMLIWAMTHFLWTLISVILFKMYVNFSVGFFTSFEKPFIPQMKICDGIHWQISFIFSWKRPAWNNIYWKPSCIVIIRRCCNREWTLCL